MLCALAVCVDMRNFMAALGVVGGWSVDGWWVVGVWGPSNQLYIFFRLCIFICGRGRCRALPCGSGRDDTQRCLVVVVGAAAPREAGTPNKVTCPRGPTCVAWLNGVCVCERCVRVHTVRVYGARAASTPQTIDAVAKRARTQVLAARVCRPESSVLMVLLLLRRACWYIRSLRTRGLGSRGLCVRCLRAAWVGRTGRGVACYFRCREAREGSRSAHVTNIRFICFQSVINKARKDVIKLGCLFALKIYIYGHTHVPRK